MNSYPSEKQEIQYEIPDDQDNIEEFILDDQHNSSNSHVLEETLYPPNSDDIKGQNVENNASELPKKSTSMYDKKKEEKKNESKKLLDENNVNKPSYNGISSQNIRNKIKRQLSLSLKNYLKKILKKQLSRKCIKILFQKKEIIHKLLDIVKKYKNKNKNEKKRHILKDILKKNIRKLLKNYLDKNPKKIESREINLGELNCFSDSFENLFLTNNLNHDNVNIDEKLNINDISPLVDISFNNGINNIVDNEILSMTEDESFVRHPYSTTVNDNEIMK